MPTIADYRSDAAYEQTADDIRSAIRNWTHPLGTVVVGSMTDGTRVSGPTTSAPYEVFPLGVVDVGAQKAVPLYRLERAWGVWGGAGPGGWCHLVSGPDLPLHRDRPYEGTRQQTERTRRALCDENPKLRYQVALLDLEREPVARIAKVTAVQIAALDAIRRGASWTRKSCGGFTKATYVALLDRGLVMNALTLRPALRLTRAGQAVLDKAKQKGRK
jgi:hypothetical protein